MSVFRSVIPDSTNNTSLERYEHFLVWLSPQGLVRQWFFSHTKGRETDRVRSEVIESDTDIRNIPNDHDEVFKCTSRFMTIDEFNYCKTIIESNRVWKVTKGNKWVPVSIEEDRVSTPNELKGFELEISFKTLSKNTMSY